MGLLALSVRIALIAAMTTTSLEGFALDDATYLRLADIMASGQIRLLSDHEFQLWTQTLTFLWPLKTLFEVTGPDRWVGQFYVAIWGTAAAVLVTGLAVRRFPVWLAIAAGSTVALLPSQVLWSSLTLKDPAVWAVLAALGLVVATANRKGASFVVPFGLTAGLLLLAMAHLRDHTLVVAAWSLPIACAFGRKDGRLTRVAVGALLSVVIPMTVQLGPAGIGLVSDPNLAERRLLNAQGARSAFIKEAEKDADGAGVALDAGDLREIELLIAALNKEAAALEARAQSSGSSSEAASLKEQAAELRQKIQELSTGVESRPGKGTDSQAEGEASAEQLGEAPSDTVSANIAHLPRGLIVMLFEPVPWREPTSSNMHLARWEMVLWYPLLLLAGFGLFHSRRFLDVLAFPILAGGGMLFVYSLAEGNIGTAFRHRGEIVWTVALLASVGAWKLLQAKRASGGDQAGSS